MVQPNNSHTQKKNISIKTVHVLCQGNFEKVAATINLLPHFAAPFEKLRIDNSEANIVYVHCSSIGEASGLKEGLYTNPSLP